MFGFGVCYNNPPSLFFFLSGYLATDCSSLVGSENF